MEQQPTRPMQPPTVTITITYSFPDGGVAHSSTTFPPNIPTSPPPQQANSRAEIQHQDESTGSQHAESPPYDRHPPTQDERIDTASQASTVPDHFEGCLFCSGQHFSSSCERMESLKARLEYLVRQARCIRCLGRHLSTDCQRDKKCFYCSSKLHHPSICYLNENINQDLKSNYTDFLRLVEQRANQNRAVISQEDTRF